MQAAKDSFYMALRNRLAALNPSRIVTTGAASRTALLVAENEAGGLTEMADAFYLDWKSASCVFADRNPLMKMNCEIRYGTLSTGNDHGRRLGELDAELMAMCTPRNVGKMDYTQTPPVALGTNLFWSLPEMNAAADDAGR